MELIERTRLQSPVYAQADGEIDSEQASAQPLCRQSLRLEIHTLLHSHAVTCMSMQTVHFIYTTMAYVDGVPEYIFIYIYKKL